ncbi:MAG: hypothetical protein AAGJ83_01665 [Planctomycetota bacterium]
MSERFVFTNHLFSGAKTMTQMLLFEPNLTSSVLPVPPSATASESSGPASTRRPAGPEADGIHQMGDLARLVLLRYQLMAKRREDSAARKRGLPAR